MLENVEYCGGEPEQADTEILSLMSDVIVLYPGLPSFLLMEKSWAGLGTRLQCNILSQAPSHMYIHLPFTTGGLEVFLLWFKCQMCANEKMCYAYIHNHNA